MKYKQQKPRHKSRQYALALLYLVEIQTEDSINRVNEFWEASRTHEEVKKFANELILGVLENRSELEKCIQENMTGWKIEKIEMLLRNLLLLAAYEMLRKQTPVKVLINEAVILAKEFINNESAPLVNKVLQKIYNSHYLQKV